MNSRRTSNVSNFTRVTISLVALNIAVVFPAWAEVLVHAHFDDATANADYALGQKDARPAVANTYKVACTTDAGRWGRALDVTRGGANCTFDAAKNLNPQRGTAELWFRIDDHKEGMYHPLFGWYRPPHQPGAKKRRSAMEVYLQNSVMTLGLHSPKSKGTSKAAPVEVGRWHHLEINWDCERGDGQSVYNIFLDGKNVIRVTDGGALEDGDGAKLHLGVWDYGFGHFLRGRIDELRITDQIEHSTEFDPPTNPYATSATIEYAKQTHRIAVERLKQFDAEIKSLLEFAGSDGDGTAARIIRSSQATAKVVERKLALLRSSLKAGNPDVKTLCTAVDAAADELSVARLPIHRISAEAAAIAAKEDRRSLLFKDLNDDLAGDAVILNGKQLFIDDYIIEETTGARRVLNRGVSFQLAEDRHGKLEAHSTCGSVLYDHKQKLFKLWYIVDSADQKQQRLCYATSMNCIDWNKPKDQLPLTVGEQIGFYEQSLKGQNWLKHHKEAFESGIVLATDRLDGFVSVDAGEDGTLTTRRFIAIGDTLVLNAKAEHGAIRVEAIDALGRVIKGFSKDNCKPITGDDFRHVVSWKAGSNCHPLQARPIKLRFHLKQAKLFSFEFQIRHNHFVPTSYSQQ
jgi:hypothetical protein